MFYLYLLECSDGTFYTGYTKDIEKRLNQHTQGKGAKYTRGRLPVKLQGMRVFPTQKEVMRAEILVKTMSRDDKLKFFSVGSDKKLQ